MALVNSNKILLDAREGRYAVGNFDTPDGDTLRGVIKAAEELNAPVILAYAEAFEELSPMERFVPWMISEAKLSGVPVCVHLDHGRSLEYIKKAVDSGFTSVMLDASDKPLDENIEFTKRVVEMCKLFDISVEAELGHVGGLEGYAYGEDDDIAYTNVEEAVRFVKETGVNSLAVSIGTVHGVYKSAPKLNIERLKELRAAVPIPLVMHGGSGLTDDDFKEVVKYGICKANIYTDLLLKACDALKANQNEHYIKISESVIGAVKSETEKKMKLFSCDGKA